MTGAGSYQFCMNGTNSAGTEVNMTPAACTTITASNPAASCTGTPWGTMASGTSNTAYSTSSVTYPNTCASQTRTCTNGTLSGSYANTSCSVLAADACGTANGIPQQYSDPSGTAACGSGAYSNSPADTSLAWNWSCGALSCSAPKFGCTTTTDTNYNASGPNNIYNCANTCANSATNYPTCTIITITFNGNGNTGGSTASKTIPYGTSAALTANGFTRTGYTFNGWNTLANGTGANYADRVNYGPVSANVTLYAQWISGDACGSGSGATPQLTKPTGPAPSGTACAGGALSLNSPADTTTSGLQAWNWSCGSVTSCSAPKYGCRITNDINYTLSQYGANGPNNNYGCANKCSVTTDTNYNTAACSGTCANSATNYSTCNTCTSPLVYNGTSCVSALGISVSPTTYSVTLPSSTIFQPILSPTEPPPIRLADY